MSGILGVALTGLGAARSGLQTTGHNIANVNTPNFSRQQVVYQANPAQYSGAGYIGTGVGQDSIRRIYSEHLQSQVQAATANAAHYEAYGTEVERLGQLLAEPETSVTGALDSFFTAVQQVAAHPADAAARQAMLYNAQAVASRFNTVDATLKESLERIDVQLRATVSSVNSYAQQIAGLNDAIVRLQSVGQTPNDLLDQRDAAVAELNRQVRASTILEGDGRMNVFLSNGQALVVGSHAQTLVLAADPLDASVMRVALRDGATSRVFREGEVSGGALGGLLAFRDEVLLPARNEVGRLALTFADAVNEQHKLGVDKNGVAGTDLFTLASPSAAASGANGSSAELGASIVDYGALTASDYRVNYDGTNYVVTRLSDNTQSTFAGLPQTVDGLRIALTSGPPAAGDTFFIKPSRTAAAALSVQIVNPAQIAAAAPIRTATAAANTGDALISAGQVDANNANLTQTVTLTFTAANRFDVSGVGTGDPANVAYTSGGAISYNGWTINITGAPRAGDVFTISANTGGTGDNRNALRLGELASAALVEGQSLSNAYARTVGSVGSKGQEVQAAYSAHQNLLNQAEQALSSVSGVNLDEEAANLLRYQQAYQASGKLIAIASSLFEQILALNR